MAIVNQTVSLAAHVTNATNSVTNSSTDAGQWNVPVILGALLALLAVVIEVPGAVLAIHKLRNRKCLRLIFKQRSEGLT